MFKFGLSDIQHEPQMPRTRERYRRKMKNVTIEYRVTVKSDSGSNILGPLIHIKDVKESKIMKRREDL